MNIKITKSLLSEYIDNVLFETNDDPDGDGQLISLPKEVPVEPSDQMSVQLSVERPPVEDEGYLPSSIKDLSKAASVIAGMVPDDQVEYFYRRLHDILDSTYERNGSTEGPKNENFYRGVIKESDDDLDSESSEMSSGMTSLEDIASEFGYSSPSGARQDLERILKRVGFTVENTDPADIESLKNIASSEYITLMKQEGFIDDEDAEELHSNISIVHTLDSFRFFFVSGFLIPAYQKIHREARRGIEAAIMGMGLPKRTKQTLLNQVIGDTPKNFDKLYKKLMRDAKSEGMSPDDAESAYDNVTREFSSLEKMGDVKGDLIKVALEIWGGSNRGRKRRILTQALSETGGDN